MPTEKEWRDMQKVVADLIRETLRISAELSLAYMMLNALAIGQSAIIDRMPDGKKSNLPDVFKEVFKPYIPNPN